MQSKERKMVKKSIKLDDVLRAIRSKCMDCSGNNRAEVDNCVMHKCELYPYRNMNAITEEEESIDGQLSMFDCNESGGRKK